MTGYAANLVASLQAGALLGPNEAARAVLPLAQEIALDHQRGAVRGEISSAYVAPEVVAGRPPTAATDVWSVGALLFHAMAGHRPYQHSPETPARLRRAGWLGPMVEMALAEDPAARPSMAELAAYLRSGNPAAEPEPTLPLPTPPPEPVVPRAVVPDAADRQRRTRILAIALGATVLVLAVVALLLVAGAHGGGAPEAAPTTAPPEATSSAPSTPATTATPHPTATPTRPTSATLVAFARTYVMTASRDPQAGFRFLTPAYQRRSPDYLRFWASVSDPRIISVSGDAARMTATYTYRYTLPAGHGRKTRTETVVLRLVQQGGRLRIAGAS
ncbi:protein kinase domain-containing protein [Nocardioides montaniterrae]